MKTTFVVEYNSCEDNFRWMTVDASDADEAESIVLSDSNVGGDSVAEILSIYAGEDLDRGGDEESRDEREL